MSHRLSALFPAWDVLEQLQESNAQTRCESGTVSCDEDAAYVAVELPGVTPDAVDVTVDDDVVHVHASREAEDVHESGRRIRQERSFGQFRQSYRLPYAVAKDRIEAELVGGVLQLTLPRAEETKPTRVPVTTRS